MVCSVVSMHRNYADAIANVKGKDLRNMERALFKATVTDANLEQGTFTAVISTVAVDRDRDIVEPSAVVSSLQKWIPTGKKVPLSWNHSVAAEDIIGHVDPATAQVRGSEVVVQGWVDQDTDRGKHAWRLVKSGTLGFSYGYLVVVADKRKGGGLHIKGLDIFEITATPIPANGETRVLEWKSVAELDAETKAQREEFLNRELQEVVESLPADAVPVEPEPLSFDAVLERVKTLTEEEQGQIRELLTPQPESVTSEKRLDAGNEEPCEVRPVDPLVKEALAVSREFASESFPRTQTAPPEKPPEPRSEKELRREFFEAMQVHLKGSLDG
jgi:HK97 family phage prohead protease